MSINPYPYVPLTTITEEDSCDNRTFATDYLCQRTDESGTTRYNYDSFGNIINMTFTERQGTIYTTHYRYDDGANIIQTIRPSERVINYTRDGVRRLSSITTLLNGERQTIVSDIRYRGDNQITQCTYGNGLQDNKATRQYRQLR